MEQPRSQPARRRNRRVRRAPLPARVWIELIALVYFPFALVFVLAGVGAYLQRDGESPFVQRVVGPVCLIAAGWTFAGGMAAAFRHGSVVILDGPYHGWSLAWRWGIVLAFIALGVGMMGLGVWLLLFRG